MLNPASDEGKNTDDAILRRNITILYEANILEEYKFKEIVSLGVVHGPFRIQQLSDLTWLIDKLNWVMHRNAPECCLK